MNGIIKFKAREGAPDVNTIPAACTMQHGITISRNERTNPTISNTDAYIQLLQDIKNLLILIVILKIICLIRKS